MSVSITWSTTDNGVSALSTDHGESSNGGNTSEVTLYLRHDGVNEISNCGFYLQTLSSGYTGAADAATDLTEVIGWGNEDTATGFGGFQINMNSEGGFDDGSTWDMSESQKTSSDGYKYTFRTGVGDSLATAITLSEKMSANMSSDGVIPASTTDVAFQCRLKVPTAEDTAGVRQFQQVLKFTFTS